MVMNAVRVQKTHLQPRAKLSRSLPTCSPRLPFVASCSRGRVFVLFLRACFFFALSLPPLASVLSALLRVSFPFRQNLWEAARCPWRRQVLGYGTGTLGAASSSVQWPDYFCFVHGEQHYLTLFFKVLCNMVKKMDIRRVVYVTCAVVGGEGNVAVPARVTLLLKRRRGCWPWPAASRQVACFNFGEGPRATSLPVSVTAPVDLEHLFKVARKANASSASVKVCVEDLRGGRRVARVDLEEFLGQLMRSGRPEWSFLHIYEEKVTLVQANHPLPEVVPEWEFEGAARATKMEKDSVQQDKDTHKKLEERPQEEKSEGQASEVMAEKSDKKATPEHTEEECAQDRNVDKEDPEHTGESVRDSDGDGELNLEHAEKKRGRDSDGDDKERPEHAWEGCERDSDGNGDENQEHTWEECDLDSDEDGEECQEDVWVEIDLNSDGEDVAQVAEGEAASDEKNVMNEKVAGEFLQREDDGKGTEKAQAGMDAGGGRRRLLSGMRAAGRFAKRALVVVGAVLFTMVLLDPLLPPFEDEDEYWSSGGGGMVGEM